MSAVKETLNGGHGVMAEICCTVERQMPKPIILSALIRYIYTEEVMLKALVLEQCAMHGISLHGRAY